jgi:hypothetical protein
MKFVNSAALRDRIANAIGAAIDTGTAGGTISIYSGPAPTDPDAPPTGTLLATLPLSNPAFGTPEGGVITANGIGQSTVAASGTAAWARIADSNGIAVFDCDVGEGDATINFSETRFVEGDPIIIRSFCLEVLNDTLDRIQAADRQIAMLNSLSRAEHSNGALH